MAVRRTSHYELTKAGFLEPEASVLGWVRWVFLPFVRENFHEFGTYGHYPDLFRECKCSGEVGLVVNTFLSMYSCLPTSFLGFPGDWQKMLPILLW